MGGRGLPLPGKVNYFGSGNNIGNFRVGVFWLMGLFCVDACGCS